MIYASPIVGLGLFGSAFAIEARARLASKDGKAISAQASTPHTHRASNDVEFAAALKAAQGGDRIELTTGRYFQPLISGRRFSPALTITSADPRKPAILIGLRIANSSGLTVSDVHLTSAGVNDKYFAFRVAASEDLTFSRFVAFGDVAKPPSEQLTGFYISRSSQVRIFDSEFRDLNAAITSTNSTGLTLSRNLFHRLNKSGLGMNGTSDAVIEDNTFRDFIVSRGTHPDAIQLYTVGAEAPARNISIKRNLIVRGQGDAIQGIFINDEVGTLPYEDVEISDNALLGGMWHAICLNHAVGSVIIKDNIVASWRGLDLAGVGTAEARKTVAQASEFISWIYLARVDNAKLSQSGNISQAYMTPRGKSSRAPEGNKLIGPVRDGGRKLETEWAARFRSRPAAFRESSALA